jgi:hypothetical protein
MRVTCWASETDIMGCISGMAIEEMLVAHYTCCVDPGWHGGGSDLRLPGGSG